MFCCGHLQNRIGLLTEEQAAALATNAPFVCEYCALDQKKRLQASIVLQRSYSSCQRICLLSRLYE